MATYLQGVTDYIPEFQPFQPDLSFYANVLQTKQTQYDSNWKAINNVYGQYFYADLTRENNIKKKDELMKQIDFNLKRVSGLDLSLDQNVQQATQVFKPFYNDEFLMKDMAWTKNYSTARKRGLALKNSKNKEDQGMYWDTGIRYMDYMRQDFMKVSDEESLDFANVTYTPYVNSMKEFQKLAKEYGDITTEHMSDDGRYLIREKNGQVLIAPLTSLFEASVANDPRLADVYRVQAVVNRKDYVMSTKDSEFQGDESAAERAYLTNQNKTIQEYVRRKKDQASQNVTVTGNNISDGEAAIKEGKDTPMTFDYLAQLQKAQGIYQTVEARAEDIETQVSNGSSTMVTSGYIPDDQLDIEALRSKVDVGTAAMLMDQDIIQAANLFAYSGHETKMTADQFALESVRQANRKALQKDQEAIDLNKMSIEAGMKTGFYIFDNKKGRIIENPKYQQTNVKKGAGASGGTPDPTTAAEENARIEQEQAEDYADSWYGTVAQILGDTEAAQRLTPQRLAEILSPTGMDKGSGIKNVRTKIETDADGNVSYRYDYDEASGFSQSEKDAFIEKTYGKRLAQMYKQKSRQAGEKAAKEWKKDPKKYLESLDASSMKRVKSKIDAFLLERASLGDQNAFEQLNSKSNVSMDMYIIGKESDELIAAHNKKILTNGMLGSLPFTDKSSKSLIDLYYNNGNPLSEKMFKTFARNIVQGPEREIWVETRDYSVRPMSEVFSSRDSEAKGTYSNKAKYNINTMFQAGALTPTNIDTFMKRDLMHNMPKEQYIALRKEILATQDARKKIQKKIESGEKLTPQEEYGSAAKRDINSVIKSFTYNQNNWDEVIDQTYQTLSSALTKDFISTKMLSKSNLIDYGKEGSKFSVAATDYAGQEVNTDVVGTFGFNAFQQMMNQDLGKSNWIYDQSRFRVSWDGTTRSGFEPESDSDDGENPKFRAQVTDMILRGLQSKIGRGEGIDFGLYQAQIANEHRGTGAMIVYPTYDFLKSMDLIGTEKAPKMITESQARRIVTNGLAIAGPRSVWKNDLFMDNKTSPAEGVLNALGKIEFKHPMGAGGYTITKTNRGPAPYSVNISYSGYDPVTGKKGTKSYTVPYTDFGNNLDEAIINIRFSLDERAKGMMQDWQNNDFIKQNNRSPR
jgi:hypothetical protein